MSDRTPPPAATGEPVVCDEDGGLSLAFDNGTLQSRMLHAAPAQLVLEYTRLMMGFLLLHPAPARIAMIGLGGGSLAKYCGRALPAADFTAIEISPPVIALRATFGIPPDGPRFRVLCADGADFVRRDGAPFDVLLVDGFDRTGQPDRLCSAAFYDDCRARLTSSGVLVVNLHTDDPDCDRHVESIRTAFGGRIVAIKADGSDNKVVFASPADPFPPPFPQLVAHLRSLAAAHPVDLDATLKKILQSREPQRPGRRRTRPPSGRRQ
ncbi:MAG: transferase [Candidatus Binatia bacterium]